MGAPQRSGPSWVDTTGQAYQPGPQETSGWLVQPVCGGALYLYALTHATSVPGGGGGAVYKSTDNGTTWTELDAANAPTGASGTAVFDVSGDRFITAQAFVPAVPAVQPLYLKTFSFASETWGPDFGTGGPNAFPVPQFVFLRPDGSIVVIYDRGPSGSGSRLLAAVFSSGSWGSPIDVGAGILALDPTGNILVQGCVGAMEPSTGIIHLAFNNNARTHFVYQQFLADNSLGVFHEFLGTNISTNSFRNMIIFHGSIYIPFPSSNGVSSFTHNSLLIGTPLTTPVWTQSSPAVMDNTPTFGNSATAIQADATTLYYQTSFFDPTFGEFIGWKLFTSIDFGVTWAIVPNNATEPYFYDFAPGESPQAPNADATFGSSNSQFTLISCGGTTTAYVFASTQNTVAGVHLNNFINSQVFSAGSPLTIAGTPPPGIVGTPYSTCFATSGGVPPYSYAITSGSLPPVLSLGPSTGCVTGTPTTKGTFPFTICVTDSASTVTCLATQIVITGSLIIQLIGWKLYPDICPNEDPEPVPEAPHVKRAV